MVDPVVPDLAPPNSLSIKCRATKSDGGRCGRYAVKGAVVCATHGGAAPQVKEAAAERLDGVTRMGSEQQLRDRLAELVQPAVDAVSDIINDPSVKPEVRLRAAEQILSRFVAPKVEVKQDVSREERDLDAEIAELLPAVEEEQAS